jgi:hypothetical protein
MFDVTCEPSRRVLRITPSGHVTASEMEAGNRTLKQLLVGKERGLRLLTDLSALDRMDPDCTPHLRSAMDLCNAAGVSRIVRVIPDPRKDIGYNILSLFHYDSRIPINTCETVAEADALLND